MHQPTPTDLSFPSGDGHCAASLWLPVAATDAPLPVVVLAHGLGGTRAMGLQRFAERFAAAGLAAITFDYRSFGSSPGTPRNVLSIAAQREDWRAAIAFVRSDARFDARHIALWGTSFSGGHVLAVAAEDHEVAAVVAQCPFTDGPASTLRVDPRSSIRLTWRAFGDLLALAAGREPVRVAVAGEPGQAALMTAADALPGYRQLAAEDPGADGETRVAARIALAIPFARPGRAIAKITTPTLIGVCEPDSVAPERATWRHIRRANNAAVTTSSYPAGHFAIYHGPTFEHVVAEQTAFLTEHLTPTPAAADRPSASPPSP